MTGRDFNTNLYFLLFSGLAFFLPVSISLSEFFYAIIFFIVIAKILKREKTDFSCFPHNKLLLLYLFFPLISFVNATNTEKSLIWFKRHLYFIIFPILLYLLTNKKIEKKLLLKIFLLGATVSSFVAISQSFFGLEFNKPLNLQTYYVFSKGLLSHSLTYAETTSFALIISLYLFFEENSKKHIYLLAFLPNFMGIILSREKTPLIAGIFISIVYVLIASKKKEKEKIGVIIALTILLIPFLIPNKQKILWRFKQSKLSYSMKVRQKVWKKSLQNVKKHPITGIGFGNFYMETEKWNKKGMEKLYHAHNNILEIMATTGIIGLIIFLLFHGAIFYDIFFSLKNKEYSLFNLAILLIFALYHIEGLTECTFKDTELNLQLFFFLALFYRENCSFIKNKYKSGKKEKPS